MNGINTRISGEYPELKEKVQALFDLGFKGPSLSALSGVDNTLITKWVKGTRPLNHANAPKIEKAIKNLIEEVKALEI